TGTIYPLNQTEIRSQLAGQVLEVLVREGDQVSRGQILAKLDSTDLKAKLNDKLGALAAGKAQLNLAEKNVENNTSLLERKFISQSAFDSVQNSYQVSTATLASLQAQVEQARKALNDAVIRAPLEGVISERQAQPGLVLAINTPLFTVQDLSLMNMEALVPTGDIAQVQVGQKAELQVEGFAEKIFIGEVDRINPSTAKGSHSIVVHLLVKNPDRRLRGGMFAQGNLAISTAISAVVVPKIALHWRGDQASVMSIENGKLVEQPVVPGIQNKSSGDIEIKSGLAAGSRVVIGDLTNLHSGQSVTIAASNTEQAQ
ncbi:MAG: efflux RND transporter periplasmic adaptor subunit, partial [Pseudomonadota bacterium]|nr:efflux RND transporter periplasmic adaptor subunit [Pseudomonadota bacterium]